MLGKACIDCKNALLCLAVKLTQPLVCPECKTEWLYVAPNGADPFGAPTKDSYAVGFADIPVVGCPKGPRIKRCPVCDRFARKRTQLSFDEHIAETRDDVARREEWETDVAAYLDSMKERLKKRGRYRVHRKDLLQWSPFDEIEEKR